MKTKSTIYIILAAALWGGIGVFFNVLSDVGFTQMQVVAIRVTSADEIAPAIEKALACGKPAVVEVITELVADPQEY